MSAASSTRQSFVAPVPKKGAMANLSPTPLMGWESYQAYLQQSADSVRQQGEVIVTFTVNPDGTLSDFSAKGEKSLQTEAIHIVQKGPIWVPVKQNGVSVSLPATVTLQFKK